MVKYTRGKLSVDQISRLLIVVRNNKGNKFATINQADTDEEEMANALRIVSCWNACIPFENPEEDIRQLVDALKESCTIIHNQIPYERNHDVAERLRDKDLALRQTLALYKNTEE